VVIDDLRTLVRCANLAALELHVPQWKVDPRGDVHHPDLIVFGLDPGARPGRRREEGRRSAAGALAADSLESFPEGGRQEGPAPVPPDRGGLRPAHLRMPPSESRSSQGPSREPDGQEASYWQGLRRLEPESPGRRQARRWPERPRPHQPPPPGVGFPGVPAAQQRPAARRRTRRSRSGRHSQWMEPSRQTSAALCTSPISASSSMRDAAESGLKRVGSSTQLCFAFLAHTGLTL